MADAEEEARVKKKAKEKKRKAQKKKREQEAKEAEREAAQEQREAREAALLDEAVATVRAHAGRLIPPCPRSPHPPTLARTPRL